MQKSCLRKSADNLCLFLVIVHCLLICLSLFSSHWKTDDSKQFSKMFSLRLQKGLYLVQLRRFHQTQATNMCPAQYEKYTLIMVPRSHYTGWSNIRAEKTQHFAFQVIVSHLYTGQVPLLLPPLLGVQLEAEVVLQQCPWGIVWLWEPVLTHGWCSEVSLKWSCFAELEMCLDPRASTAKCCVPGKNSPQNIYIVYMKDWQIWNEHIML